MTVSSGLDASVEMTRHAISLKSQGFDFVMRYYSASAWKNLSLGEAQALSDAGLKIGAVWETGGTRNAFFSHAHGVADGSAACRMASELGQPLASAIYFAVDYDPEAREITDFVIPYFKGIRAGFLASSNGNASYLVGVYGSGLCCATLIEAGLADMSWLSQSTGFAGSKDYAAAQRYNLIQYLPAKITVDDGVVLTLDPDASCALRPAGLFTLS